MRFLCQRLGLLRIDPRETGERKSHQKLVIFDQPPWSRSPEHANLIDDVVPVTRCLELLCQQPVQFLAHINDASGHCAHIPFPLLEQLGVVQYKCDLEPLG